ncbi:MAG: UDP-N-acetylmuramoyl-L-alanyl-D-glutamate--2,6-diaminopimelate ligase [Desulfopila sp.]
MNQSDQVLKQAPPPGAGARLAELLAGLDYRLVVAGASGVDTVVAAVSGDSRTVTGQMLFVAQTGLVSDGHCHVLEATRGGCSAVVVERGAEWRCAKSWQGTVVEVADSRHAYACIAENYYGRPAERLKLIGLTGTNGKTTVSFLLEDTLMGLGYRLGVIGTVNYRYHTDSGSVILPSPYTTPEPLQLQGLLFEMAQAGVELVVMEVSSHALVQQRVGNLRYDIAAFTNLSRDHLDYHRSMAEYFAAKRLLFARHLKVGGKAVVSWPQQPEDETDWSEGMARFCADRAIEVLRCGKLAASAVQLLDYRSFLERTTIDFRCDGREYTLHTPLVGHFNVDNLLTAMTIARALGHQPDEIVAHLSNSIGAPGRLQRVFVDDGTELPSPVVFVDYAHTPDALRQVLATLAALPHRELYCVFGCGGDRDTGKRPVMGAFAAAVADVVVVTDDNPRSEDPGEIRNQIVAGVQKKQRAGHEPDWLQSRAVGERGFVVIGKRDAAIEATVRAAGADDIVLIAGKGHENYQLSQGKKRFFADSLEAECALLSWSVEAVAQATGGRIYRPEMTEVKRRLSGGVSTDSRSLQPGDIFVALRGEHFDGHDFLPAVVDRGAGCLVVESVSTVPAPVSVARVVVDDTLAALADLARFRRQLVRKISRPLVIAITGSCGKTTVKEMTAAILRHHWPSGSGNPENSVLATTGNLNNVIGMPLTLLPITPRQRAAVLEMGMNAPGEIRRMAKSAEADISCITNVHGVHLAGLHDLAGVARAKGELFAESAPEGILVVNLDDEWVRTLAEPCSQRKITFSLTDPGADLFVGDIEALAGAGLRFMLHRQGETTQIVLDTVGLHNVANGLTAAAIATAAGATLAEIARGLADYRPADRRMVRMETAAGLGVLNDTYNANPASMVAGLQTLIQMGGRQTAAVLGDMLELGDSAVAAHGQLGRQAAEAGLGFLAVVGDFREHVAAGALAAGMAADRVRLFAEKDAAADWISSLVDSGALAAGDWLLVKASRGLRMETIVERLTGNT